MPLSAQEALMSDPRADINRSEGRCSCLSEFSGIQEKPGATSTDWTGGSLDTSRMLSLMLLIRRIWVPVLYPQLSFYCCRDSWLFEPVFYSPHTTVLIGLRLL